MFHLRFAAMFAMFAMFATLVLAATVSRADAGSITVFPLPARGYMPDSVVRAADGSIWFSAAELSPCHGNVTCQTEALGSLHGTHATEAILGPTTLSDTFGAKIGPARTIWLTDATKAAYVFDLSGKKIATVHVSDGNGSGALSAPFIGPDGRMWFAQGSFGLGATGIVAVDASYRIERVAPCKQCFFSGGVVAADGNAWLIDPYLGGFYRVTPGGDLKRFDYGTFVLNTMIAGPNAELWGLQNASIDAYDLHGTLRASFAPSVPVQSGLATLDGDLIWANVGPGARGGELTIVRMTPRGAATTRRYAGLGTCSANAKQWYSTAPVRGGDGALYVGIGCSSTQYPYTRGGNAAIVRIAT